MDLDIDYTKLLFAAEVDKLARKRFEAKREKTALSCDNDPATMAQWSKENPFQHYIDSALQSLLSTARYVEETIESTREGIAQASR
jgi:hypothetical protein